MTEALLMEAAEDRTNEAELQPRPLRLEFVQVASLLNERVREGVADIESLTRMPMQLIEKYAEQAARHAILKRYPDGWLATIFGFPGVWAMEPTEEETRKVLEEVVLDWTLLKIEHGDNDLPVIEQINLNDVL